MWLKLHATLCVLCTFFYCSFDDESKCKNTSVKRASFKMPGKNESFAMNLNVIKHTEGGGHQLSVCKVIVLARMTIQSIVQNNTK
jgi:hypothetical protein